MKCQLLKCEGDTQTLSRAGWLHKHLRAERERMCHRTQPRDDMDPSTGAPPRVNGGTGRGSII